MATGPPLYFPSLDLDFLFYEMGRGNGVPWEWIPVETFRALSRKDASLAMGSL